MLWKISPATLPESRANTPGDGRFVLHRHHDAHGPHLDLRLESGACLLGWRIDGPDLNGERYASGKPPHPTRWLDHDGDAIRQDAGVYAWVEQDDDGGVLELRGERATYWLSIRREPTLSPAELGEICHALREHDVAPAHAAVLIHDGRLARRRALVRLCALGRELDGAAFDDKRWHALLTHASLDEIHHHLRAFEIRFDTKYPPQPVSQPERLPDEPTNDRRQQARAILQGA